MFFLLYFITYKKTNRINFGFRLLDHYENWCMINIAFIVDILLFAFIATGFTIAYFALTKSAKKNQKLLESIEEGINNATNKEDIYKCLCNLQDLNKGFWHKNSSKIKQLNQRIKAKASIIQTTI
jgi:hypothetical protein